MPFCPPHQTDSLETLAEHCLAAHAIIGERGSATMRRLIDLLLYEIGTAIAGEVLDEDEAEAIN